MAGGLGGLIGGIGGLVGGIETAKADEQSAEGDIQEANMYAQVAKMYGQEMNITKGAGAIALGQEQKKIEGAEGTLSADLGKGNVSMGGSGGDILRSVGREGALAKQTIEGKTAIDVQSESIAQEGALIQETAKVNEAKQAQAAAGAAVTSGIFSMVGGIFGMFGL